MGHFTTETMLEKHISICVSIGGSCQRVELPKKGSEVCFKSFQNMVIHL